MGMMRALGMADRIGVIGGAAAGIAAALKKKKKPGETPPAQSQAGAGTASVPGVAAAHVRGALAARRRLDEGAPLGTRPVV